MTNREKFYDRIKNGNFCDLAMKEIGIQCEHTDCPICAMRFAFWLGEEYKEPEVDWNKVPIDARVEVSNDMRTWYKRHFAGIVNGFPSVFDDGKTSFTANNNSATTLIRESDACSWSCIRLCL